MCLSALDTQLQACLCMLCAASAEDGLDLGSIWAPEPLLVHCGDIGCAVCGAAVSYCNWCMCMLSRVLQAFTVAECCLVVDVAA
jgi:hypothetical protein